MPYHSGWCTGGDPRPCPPEPDALAGLPPQHQSGLGAVSLRKHDPERVMWLQKAGGLNRLEAVPCEDSRGCCGTRLQGDRQSKRRHKEGIEQGREKREKQGEGDPCECPTLRCIAQMLWSSAVSSIISRCRAQAPCLDFSLYSILYPSYAPPGTPDHICSLVPTHPLIPALAWPALYTTA